MIGPTIGTPGPEPEVTTPRMPRTDIPKDTLSSLARLSGAVEYRKWVAKTDYKDLRLEDMVAFLSHKGLWAKDLGKFWEGADHSKYGPQELRAAWYAARILSGGTPSKKQVELILEQAYGSR